MATRIVDMRATVQYSPLAFEKLVALLREFDTEVAWLGVTERVRSDENLIEYLISDIVVYPQKVTGTTVDMDDEAYASWLIEKCKPEDIGKLHMQGHSHVRMSTFASGTDAAHQREIVKDMDRQGFYIFQIWNKSLDCTSKIYDFDNDVIFDTEDVTNRIGDSTEDIPSFVEASKGVVSKATASTASSYAASPTSVYARGNYDDVWEYIDSKYKYPRAGLATATEHEYPKAGSAKRSYGKSKKGAVYDD